MKLFRFNPNGYGEQAFVVAATKEDAIEALKTSVHNMDDNDNKDHYQDKIEVMIDEAGGYTIDEINPLDIVWSEIA